MKTYIKAVFYTLLSCGLLSCSDWFDVSPKTDVKASELFETEAGFESALTGIYVEMTRSDTYGSNYTYGFMDMLTRRYDQHALSNPTEADWAVIYDYTKRNDTFNSKTVLSSIWRSSYFVIANANNLITWLDRNGNRVIINEQARNHMRGQALALRAMVHFDLLRSWGPCYRSDSTSLAIPYRIVADARRLRLLPANEVMTKIVADLKHAERLMSDQEGTSLVNSKSRYRMTVHSVRGLLARVCNYRNAKTDAVKYAKSVIDHSGLEMVTVNTEDPAMFGETLFALSVYKMTEVQTKDFTEGPLFINHKYITTNSLTELFEGLNIGTNDIRYRHGYGFLQYAATQQAIVRKYLRDQNTMPLIRLVEMYYILCESLPLDESAQWLDFVRNKRGISNTNNYGNFATDASRTGALDLEYRKEFYAEGQYFFFLKVNEMKTFFKCPISQMSKDEYIFPLPDNEKEYGWTDETDDSE